MPPEEELKERQSLLVFIDHKRGKPPSLMSALAKHGQPRETPSLVGANIGSLTLHVTIEHWGGSVQHYYHFLLGFFVPLVDALSTSWGTARVDQLLVRSCGPCDQVLAELGDPRIRILDYEQHRRLAPNSASVADSVDTATPSLGATTIRGYDVSGAYERAPFSRVTAALRRTQAVQEQIRDLEETWQRGDSRILVIERGPSPAFYNSEQSEFKSSGDERRSIPNFPDVYRSLRMPHEGCRSVRPETLPLARQFALFAMADVIVAQHGAALANIIWARPGATVIEILPDDVVYVAVYRDLARCLGLRHRYFRQEHSHANVDADELRTVVGEAVDHPDWLIACRLRRILFQVLLRRWAVLRENGLHAW